MSSSAAAPGAVCCFYTCYSRGLPLTTELDISTGRTTSRRGEVTITALLMGSCRSAIMTSFTKPLKHAWPSHDLPNKLGSLWQRLVESPALWDPGELIHPLASCGIPESQNAAHPQPRVQPGTDREVRTQLRCFSYNRREPGCIRMGRKKQLWSFGGALCTAEQDCRQ